MLNSVLIKRAKCNLQPTTFPLSGVNTAETAKVAGCKLHSLLGKASTTSPSEALSKFFAAIHKNFAAIRKIFAAAKFSAAQSG